MVRRLPLIFLFALSACASLFISSCAAPAKTMAPAKVELAVAPVVSVVPDAAAPMENLPVVALGIDVLEEKKFAPLAGKRIGLLTHPAGVNRRGISTIEVLAHAPGVNLAVLFAPEHGMDGQIKAAKKFGDSVHGRTGLPIYSLHGETKKPTPAMLKGLDAVVIDLQDIGVRSYTFVSAMKLTMEACFENKVEVVVLDRPNPLGGLKVDGPLLDQEFKSYVGAFRVPYVHGLTIAELARMAKEAPGVLDVTDEQRERGKLTIVAMRGWNRAMRWPETGLTWVPTSPYLTSFDAVVGNAMVGLGGEPHTVKTWVSGIGISYPFRGIGFPKRKPDEIIAELGQYKIPGINLVKKQGVDTAGKPMTGVYVEVTDWEAWRATELSFYMMKTAAKWKTPNLFATLSAADTRTLNIHVGSAAWSEALKREGEKIDVAAFLEDWRKRAKIYQTLSKAYWIYP